ncbi:MAG: acyl-CoA synthetase [Haloarculaceae archaeon]
MVDAPTLDAYQFHEQEWESYEELVAAFEWEVPDQFNIATYACDRWADDRGRVALFAEDGDGGESTHTFWQLRTAANRLANYLAERGVGRGDRICVSGSQKPGTILGHLAAWKLGAVSVPLSVLLGPDGLSYRLADSGATAFVVDAASVEAFRAIEADLPSLETVLTVGDAEPAAGERDLQTAIADASPRRETATTAADDPAIVIYTSGTTGDPKGVVHGHATLLGTLPCVNLGALNATVSERDVGRTVVEWSWAGALFDFLLPLWYYGRPVVAHEHGEFDPATEFELVETYGITVVNAPPTALRMLMQVEDPAETYDLRSLRVLFSGGESVGDTIVDWADDAFENAVVHEGYGQTEAPAFIGDCSALGVDHRAGKMGVASPGSEVRILDPDTGEETVDPGEIGEIALRYEGNPGCFAEYLNKPEKTAGKVEDGWLLSEDLGSVDEDGYVTFQSRKDDVIISAGYKIGPEEVEDALAGHPAVADAGVVGVPDDTRGEIPKAFVVLAAGHGPSEVLAEELTDHVRDRLAKYEYPREIEFVDDLPTTTTGKVRRRDLRARDD